MALTRFTRLLRRATRTHAARAAPPRPGPYIPLEPLAVQMMRWQPVDARERVAVERAAALVDAAAFAAIQARYREEVERGGPRGFGKYMDLGHGFRTQVRVLVDLDLDRRAPLSVLDIGSGGGQFLALCRAFGHRPMGLDCAEPRLYGDLLALLGVPRIVGGIGYRAPLPEGTGRFDLIVIKGQIFDVKRPRRTRWDVADWLSLLAHLRDHHLVAGGGIYVDLNTSLVVDGRREYLMALVEQAAEAGATRFGDRAAFLAGPAALEGLAGAASFAWIAPDRPARERRKP